MKDFAAINIVNNIQRFLNYISNHSTVFHLHLSILYKSLALDLDPTLFILPTSLFNSNLNPSLAAVTFSFFLFPPLF